MFQGIKNTYKKSEAAVIVQNLLQLRKNEGGYYGDPASEATNLVKSVYEVTPELFNGKRGLRPHKLSFAAQALAYGLKDASGDSRKTLVFLACLEQVLQEVEKNQILYPLNQLDQTLLGDALLVFEEQSTLYNQSPLGKEMNNILGTKEKASENEGEEEHKVANIIIGMISLQTFLVPGFKNPDDWSLGYIIGFSDAFVQRKGYTDQNNMSGYVVITFVLIELFGHDQGPKLFGKYMNLQKSNSEQKAMIGASVGGQEALNWLDDTSAAPLELASHLRNLPK